LSENLWSCGCDFIAPFSDFLERKKELIADYDSVICVSSREGLKSGEPCPTKKSISRRVKNVDGDVRNEALELVSMS